MTEQMPDAEVLEELSRWVQWQWKSHMGRTPPCTCDVCRLCRELAKARAGKGTITLCGSTRFKAAYIDWLQRLTDEGWRVFSVGRFLPKGRHGEQLKADLDKLHLRKIDASEAIFVLDVSGYIGDSTRREIAHAEASGTAVRYLSHEYPDYVEPPLTQTDIGLALESEWKAQLAEARREVERLTIALDHERDTCSSCGSIGHQRHCVNCCNDTAEVERLKLLAIHSGDEGTSFYYRDAFEAEAKEVKRLTADLARYRECLRGMSDAVAEAWPQFFHYDPADRSIGCADCGTWAGSVENVPHTEDCPVAALMRLGNEAEALLKEGEDADTST